MFIDRKSAGKKLAQALSKIVPQQGVVVYAIPRGGVVVGFQVARRLGVPLHVIPVCKVRHPLSPEWAVGAVSDSGRFILAETVSIHDENWITREIKRAQKEARRRARAYRRGVAESSIRGKIAVLVDDGIATGLTLMVAIGEARQRGARRIFVAVPVALQSAAEKIARICDRFVALDIVPDSVGSIGSMYEDFDQVMDTDVKAILSMKLST